MTNTSEFSGRSNRAIVPTQRRKHVPYNPTRAATGAAHTQNSREVGSFELTLLSAINALRSEAWGSNLQKHTSRVLGRDVAIGQLYLGLARLEQKGLISSEQKDPEPIRGGRSKKVFKLEAPGVKALERMAAIVDARGASPTEKYHGESAY